MPPRIASAVLALALALPAPAVAATIELAFSGEAIVAEDPLGFAPGSGPRPLSVALYYDDTPHPDFVGNVFDVLAIELTVGASAVRFGAPGGAEPVGALTVATASGPSVTFEMDLGTPATVLAGPLLGLSAENAAATAPPVIVGTTFLLFGGGLTEPEIPVPAPSFDTGTGTDGAGTLGLLFRDPVNGNALGAFRAMIEPHGASVTTRHVPEPAAALLVACALLAGRRSTAPVPHQARDSLRPVAPWIHEDGEIGRLRLEA